MSFTDQTTQEYDDFGGSKTTKEDGSYEPKSSYQNAADKQAAAAASAVETASNRAQSRSFDTIDKGVSANKDLSQNDLNIKMREMQASQSNDREIRSDKNQESAKDRQQAQELLTKQIEAANRQSLIDSATQQSIASGANTTSQENAKTSAKAQVSAALYGRKSSYGGYW